MALPGKLKFFNVFFDNTEYWGQCPELTLPKLTQKVENYRAGGMPGSVAVNLGFDDGALDVDVTMGGLIINLLKKFGTTTADGMQFRYSGSYQAEDSDTPDAIDVYLRGRFNEVDMGSAKAGDDTSHKYTLKSTYYKLVVNDETIMEIDMINMIFTVDGVDVLAAHRKAIGH
ncbi:phage major tail tube protein [Salmonella enterica]|nr:phage major tail tube protein [Salmonella enterica]EEA2271396.1 phage major tail tube protein [Salmonella enterica]EFV5114801.1 phage major tail tube protein [Salmonella enterica]EGB7057501.1 phage major tail tube protein [Salmonella enterica]EGO6390942.1 phage major tail tube protein [Salmonella enterica]